MGTGVSFSPQLPNDVDPGLSREHDVQDEEIVVMDVGHEGALGTVMGHIHGIPVLPESLLQEAGDLLVVLYYEDSHGFQVFSAGAQTQVKSH